MGGPYHGTKARELGAMPGEASAHRLRLPRFLRSAHGPWLAVGFALGLAALPTGCATKQRPPFPAGTSRVRELAPVEQRLERAAAAGAGAGAEP